MRKCGFFWISVIISFLMFGCINEDVVEETNESEHVKEEVQQKEDDEIEEVTDNEVKDFDQYSRSPNEWGENVSGVKRKIKTDKEIIALTFDACGGRYGSGFDEELINFLIEEEVPATLFINKRWIDENREQFLKLTNNSLFQIENHGTDHLPLSVNGQAAWGIKGTNSPEDVYNEVIGNQLEIERLTGRAPTLFRSGTAFYDDISVQIVEDMGLQVVNFDVLGDAGATFTAEQVREALLSANKGSIALLHMNQPQSGTREGVMMAIPLLREKGFEFVTLDGYDLE
ncbi:polysaccharide deacetylase family protein [Bacillus sp. FJAT-45350]|uniref:polysaccharide deacetylase family protein n=1 Tax=Bacillus sp. FJAT-45350 TaxID=2011014 RepID=UPI00211C5210|nr:polysaccharide deacetylase family protein [Bacillus sp. FJAT-45350]